MVIRSPYTVPGQDTRGTIPKNGGMGERRAQRPCGPICTMGLRARREARYTEDSTGSEAHRTGCFRKNHTRKAWEREGVEVETIGLQNRRVPNPLISRCKPFPGGDLRRPHHHSPRSEIRCLSDIYRTPYRTTPMQAHIHGGQVVSSARRPRRIGSDRSGSSCSKGNDASAVKLPA